MTAPARPPRQPLRCATALAVAAAGVAMILASIPVAVSDRMERPGDRVLERLQAETAVNEADVERLVRSRKASAQWRQTASSHTELALGRLILGELEDGEFRPIQAEISLREGLGLAPMDPYGWMRLVQLRQESGAPAAEVAAPLRLALRSGPHEDRRHAMLLLMVEAGLMAWDELDGAERALIGEKARAAWARDVPRTAAAAVRTGRADVLAGLLGF